VDSDNNDSAEPGEGALTRDLARGDREAWQRLYDQYSVRVWRYVARLVGSDSAAVADIVQETFLAAAKGAGQVDSSKGTLWSWLSGIAHHRVARHWQVETRQRRIHQEVKVDEDWSRWWSSAATDPASQVVEGELVDVVRVVLARLSSDYSTLLAARYLDGLGIPEIQRLVGGSAEAVRSRLHRARQEFRSEFERIHEVQDVVASSDSPVIRPLPLGAPAK
jgi:RNA polymerase sigma-70 factor (ECF subfamily)